VVSLPSIPAGQSSFLKELTCPEACTNQFPHPINVFGSILHMHQIGSQIWSSHYREGVYMGQTKRIEYFNFDTQQTVMVNYTIQPGDRVNTHCIWDSTSRSTATNIGVASDDEMCLEFLFYYPVMSYMDSDFAYCGYISSSALGLPAGSNYTVCGSMEQMMASIMDVPNPIATDAELGFPRIFGSSQECVQELDLQKIGISVGVVICLLVLVGLTIGLAVYYRRKRRAAYSQLPDNISIVDSKAQY